jgi:hypothetical protein
MPELAVCPNERELQALFQGEGEPDHVDAFAAHLERCDHCADVLERSLSGDLLVKAMRSQATAPATPGSSVVSNLMRLSLAGSKVTDEGLKPLHGLTGPDPIRLNPACFTPDGAQLITHGSETRAIHIFDLRAIRRQLAEMGLDWNLPPYPLAKEAEAPKPLQVQVIP